MNETLIAPGESVHLQMHRKLGPFEHLLCSWIGGRRVTLFWSRGSREPR